MCTSKSTTDTTRRCPDCGVEPGQPHQTGCDVERCMLCGGQMIGCNCVYTASGILRDVDDHEPTQAMWDAYDAKVAAVGGPDVWTGEWPGEAECIEFGWFSKWDKEHERWMQCAADDPEGGPDLNRLHPFHSEALWNPEKRRWVKR